MGICHVDSFRKRGRVANIYFLNKLVKKLLFCVLFDGHRQVLFFNKGSSFKRLSRKAEISCFLNMRSITLAL